MRSKRRSLPQLDVVLVCAALVCAVAFALTPVGPARADSAVAGATGGDWQTVDAASLAGQRITALLPGDDGRLWVGAEERGLVAGEGGKWRPVGVRDGLPDSRIVALFRDRQGRLWVSTGAGLGYFPPAGGPFRRIGLAGLRSLPVLAFAQAPGGAILFGGASGLTVWEPDGALQPAPDLDGLAVNALHAGRDGVVWAGTSAGLWRGVEGKWAREAAIGDGRVAAIAESPEGRIYAAGETGLWEMRGGTWQRLASPVKGDMTAVAVRDGSVWLGTAQGVVAGQEGVWEAYDPKFLPHARVTALAWADHVLWVGTTAGLVAHRPDASPPRIAIVEVNDVRPDGGAVQLRSDRLVRLRLEAGDRATPASRLRVFTRLDGVDAAPRLLSESERRDLANVTVYAGRALPPGSYVLRAWAQDDAFNRSAESQVTLVVPRLARGPAGLTYPQEAAYAGFAGLALVLTAGATTAAAGKTRRRQIQHAEMAAAARVRTAQSQSARLYSASLPLREAEVAEAVTALKRGHLLLLGETGMGKTATLGQVAAALPAMSDRSVVVAPAPLDVAAVAGHDFFHALMSAATAALYPLAAGARPRLRWHEEAATGYGEEEFSADLGLLVAWLQPLAGRRVSLVFLLDNAGALDGYESRQRDAFRRLIVAASAPDAPVRLALAARAAPGVVAGFADLFHAVRLAPLPQARALQLVRGGAQGLVVWAPDAERVAVARARGNPAALTAGARAAAQAALADGRLDIAVSDVP